MESELSYFPKKLINDVEGFIFYYPKKFPKIKEKYLQLIEKYYNDPENFRLLCLEQSEKLMSLAKRFAGNYKDIGDETDLKKLIEVDQKMHKLSCFNFWLYNYLICEGPLQEFHISKIKEIAEKVADGRDIEEVEKNIERIETILIKTDYTDFYVGNLLRGLRIYNKLRQENEFQGIIEEMHKEIGNKDYKILNKLVAQIIHAVEKDKIKYNEIWEEFLPMLKVSEIQKTLLPVYSIIIVGFEYKEKAEKYIEDYKKLKGEIADIFNMAEKKLSQEDYSQMLTSYKMLRLLAECKDLFGMSDTITIPFWFNLINLIAKKLGNSSLALGQGSSYYSFMWHVSGELKDIIYKIDNTEFNEVETFFN